MGGTPYGACKAMKHPYYAKAREDYFWDVGLILLTNKITLGRKINIATIAHNSAWRNVKHSMTVAGFGNSGVSMGI